MEVTETKNNQISNKEFGSLETRAKNGINALQSRIARAKADALKTIDAYESLDALAKSFRALYDIMGPELFFKFARDMDEFLLMIQKDGIDNVAPYIFMKITMQMDHLDPDTRTRMAKQLMEQFPDTKQRLKEGVDSVSELF